MTGGEHLESDAEAQVRRQLAAEAGYDGLALFAERLAALSPEERLGLRARFLGVSVEAVEAEDRKRQRGSEGMSLRVCRGRVLRE